MWRIALSVVVSACSFTPGRLPTQPIDATETEIDAVDIDAGVQPIDAALWSNVTEIVAGPGADDPTLTADRLELYFNFDNDIYLATRGSVTDPWGAATLVMQLSSAGSDTTPEVSGDGLTMFIASDRPGAGTLGQGDLWMATRASRTVNWEQPVHIATLSSSLADSGGTLSADQLTIAMSSHRTGSAGLADLYLATRATPTSTTWTSPAPITVLNTTFSDADPVLSPDALTIYFFSNRTTVSHFYVSTRTSATAEFEAAMPITELDSAGGESDPWVSPDGHTIVFERGGAIYEATR